MEKELGLDDDSNHGRRGVGRKLTELSRQLEQPQIPLTNLCLLVTLEPSLKSYKSSFFKK